MKGRFEGSRGDLGEREGLSSLEIICFDETQEELHKGAGFVKKKVWFQAF